MDQDKAFAVDGELAPDRPPATAEEYLKQVRWQANRIDDVIVADDVEQTVNNNQPVFGMQGFSDVPKIPAGMKPSRDWEIDFIDKFIEERGRWEERKTLKQQTGHLSKQKQTIPSPKDKKQWRDYCFGTNNNVPTASVIMSLDFVSLQKVSFFFANIWRILNHFH